MPAATTFVIDEADIEPVRTNGDTASVRVTFDASNGCDRLEQRLIRFATGRSRDRALAGRQEVLFVVDGSIFVTSAGVNPTRTIQALALYVADNIKGRLATLFD